MTNYVEAICRKCQVPSEMPTKRVDRGDPVCRSCDRIYNKEYRKRRKEAGTPVVSGKMTIDYFREYDKGYLERDGVRERKAATQRKRAKKPIQQIKDKARRALRRKVKTSEIIKKSCEVCGHKDVQGHHEDYGKPFDVIWLCVIHHAQLHSAKAKER